MPPADQRDTLDALVRDACQGSADALERHFIKRGGLPGPRPNFALARDAAAALLAQGAAGRQYLQHLAGLGEREAQDDTAHEFKVVVGVMGLGLEAARDKELSRSRALQVLQGYVEDGRRHVRGSVHVALAEVLKEHGDAAVAAFASWTDGYLQAEAVLRALTLEEAERAVRDAQGLIARLDEAFQLAEKAPRSHERSHGYRALVRALGDVPARIGKRFASQVLAWLEARAATRVPELRDALQQATAKLRKAGARAGDVQAVQQALDAAEPPRRDPRSYVGPTRKRSKR